MALPLLGNYWLLMDVKAGKVVVFGCVFICELTRFQWSHALVTQMDIVKLSSHKRKDINVRKRLPRFEKGEK